jgi:hypothetical protein
MLGPHNLIRGLADSFVSSPGIDRAKIESREDCVKKDLTLRLKGVCTHLSSVDFEVLVCDMTRVQLRGEGIPGSKLRPC